MAKNKTPARTSPKGGKRGCLCDDGKTYHRDCCDGSLQAQGIGSPYNGNQSNITQNIVVRVITNS